MSRIEKLAEAFAQTVAGQRTVTWDNLCDGDRAHYVKQINRLEEELAFRGFIIVEGKQVDG